MSRRINRWLNRFPHRSRLLIRCRIVGRQPTDFLLLDDAECEPDEPHVIEQIPCYRETNPVASATNENPRNQISESTPKSATSLPEMQQNAEISSLVEHKLTNIMKKSSSKSSFACNVNCKQTHDMKSSSSTSLLPSTATQSMPSESIDNGECPAVSLLDSVRQHHHHLNNLNHLHAAHHENRSFDNLLHRVERVQQEMHRNRVIRNAGRGQSQDRRYSVVGKVHGSEDNLLHCIPPAPTLNRTTLDQPTHCWPCGCSAEHVRLLKVHQCVDRCSATGNVAIRSTSSTTAMAVSRKHASADELTAVPEPPSSQIIHNRYVNVSSNASQLSTNPFVETDQVQLNYSDLQFTKTTICCRTTNPFLDSFEDDAAKSSRCGYPNESPQPNNTDTSAPPSSSKDSAESSSISTLPLQPLLPNHPPSSSMSSSLSSSLSSSSSPSSSYSSSKCNDTSSTAVILYAKMDFAAMNSLQKVKSTRAENLRSIDTMSDN